jgi:quinol monooxygenase YgiN
MFCCLIEIVVKKYKKEEFVESINSFKTKFRKQRGCLSYHLYQDSEDENTFRIVGEWKTRQTMEKHFQTREYVLLLGAAKVLGEKFTIETAEISKSGNFDWARQQITSHKRKDAQDD